MTINDIQRQMRADGSHWWDPDTMRMFGTKVVSPVFDGPGGIYFVTSEFDGFRGREENRRVFTVRKYTEASREIDTIGDLGEWSSRTKAKNYAEHLAGDKSATAASEPLRPVTDLDQLVSDCQKHGNPLATAGECGKLIKAATLHHSLMEQYYNGRDLYTADGEPKSALRNNRNQIFALATAVGATGVVFSGDPRGCTVKITFPDQYTDDFAKEGLCVPVVER